MYIYIYIYTYIYVAPHRSWSKWSKWLHPEKREVAGVIVRYIYVYI